MSINKYDPRLKKHDELEKTLACGGDILSELMKSLKPGKDKKLSNQSWILTGPRGAGKSHLLALLYRNIKADKALAKYWHPLSFPEELFDVDSLYRLLFKILENLFDSYKNNEKLGEAKEQYLQLKKIRITGNLKQKKDEKHRVAKELLDLFYAVREITGGKFILMLENLQHLFKGQLPEDDLKMIRGFMNEKPDVFIIMGTALAVFDEIENYGKPFYHFFRLRSLDSLDRQGIIDFLIKTAEFRGDEDIPRKTEANRHYIYVYHLLTGGNPRLILFLYELLLDNERLDTEMILTKISELTPYFLDKTREESSQRKLILDTLATESPAQTATEIAEYINEDQKSITEQLKRLHAEGWVKEIAIEAEGIKSKEVFYTLRDYFFRIWYQLRMKDINESDVYCMAELAAIIFNRKELEERAVKYADRVSEKKVLYEKSLELSLDERFMRNINLLRAESEKLETKEIINLMQEHIGCFIDSDWEKMIETSEKLATYPGYKSMAHENAGQAYYKMKRYNDAYESFSLSTRNTPIYKDHEYLGFAILQFKLKNIAESIFDSHQEMRKLLDETSSLEIKTEAVCRMLLLGKFETVTDSFDLLLKEKELPEYESKKLDFFMIGYIVDNFKNGKENKELTTIIKYWIQLNKKISDYQTIRGKFIYLLYSYMVVSGDERIYLSNIEKIINQFHEEGIVVSDVFIDILKAVKNPDTREAQKWMADPLFAGIVEQLSQIKNKKILKD